MKIILVSNCSLDIEQYVEFKMSLLISPSKSLISSRWVTSNEAIILPLNKYNLQDLSNTKFWTFFFFDKHVAFRTDFWPKWDSSETSWTRFWQIFPGHFFGLGTENLPNLGIFWPENWEILWFFVRIGVLWNWKMLKRGSFGASGGA